MFWVIDLTDIEPALHKGLATLAADMRTHGYRRDEPVREVFALLGDRWTTLILLVLRIGTFRHAELRRALGRLGAEGRISQRILTHKLRALERNGIVMRHATQDVPPRVSYELSLLGQSLILEVDRLMQWIHHADAAINMARDNFDSRSSLAL